MKITARHNLAGFIPGLQALRWPWSLSRVRLFVTPWTTARQATLSKGILQARILGWVTTPSSRGSSQPRDQTLIS